VKTKNTTDASSAQAIKRRPSRSSLFHRRSDPLTALVEKSEGRPIYIASSALLAPQFNDQITHTRYGIADGGRR
jgi:hypothetical protein